MELQTGGPTRLSDEPKAPDHVTLEVVNYGRASEDHGVTRRRALTGGATALIAAAVGGATLSDADGALASTTKTKKKAKKLEIKVNGRNREVTYTRDTMLLYVLRDEFLLRGPKFGCGLEQCGACAVLLDGVQIRSCITPVGTVAGKSVVTLDGLAETWHGKSGKKKFKKGDLHPLQQAWIDEQVPQCGYCQSGMIIQAASLLAENPDPTLAEIKKNMNGHLCRCGTYNAIFRAVQRAAKEMAK